MRLVYTTLLAAISLPALAQAPVQSTPEDRQSLSLTVYTGGFAVVREVRPLRLPAGRAIVRFEGDNQRSMV